MTTLRKSYTFQSFFKNVTLLILLADSSADSPIKNNLWLFELKTFFFGQIEFSNFKKTPFRYVFSIVIMYSRETAQVKVLLSKGCMVAVRNYRANTIKEKNKQRGKGAELRIMNFRAQMKKFENFSWIVHSVFYLDTLSYTFELPNSNM